MNNCTIIIFGATGDLAQKKLFPALYRLIAEKRITNVALIGAAFTNQQSSSIIDAVKPYIQYSFDQQVWDFFVERFSYQRLDFNNHDDFVLLHQKVKEVEKQYRLSGNRLLYCASAAQFFVPITHYSVLTGLITKKNNNDTLWHRIVYEKPFGKDLFSAHDINNAIADWLYENQIYRIDHYLTKEVVSSITLNRFTNCIFEPLWNNRYIDQVHITLSENFGIENRGTYYDRYGALADVVQNHMLQLLALVSMDAPRFLSGDYVREQRAKVLQSIEVIDGLLGQYDGYTQEKYVLKNSKTETFAYLFLRINTPRWSGVPFFLKTGKCLDKKETSIDIKFKRADSILSQQYISEPNWLKIQIAPNESMNITLNTKKPGYSMKLAPVTMSFGQDNNNQKCMPTAYEMLLQDVLSGEQASVVRFDEIESAWNIIGMIKEKRFPLYTYSKGSSGPDALKQFINKYGVHIRV